MRVLNRFYMKANKFDRKFDEGSEDILSDLDLSSATRVNQRMLGKLTRSRSIKIEDLDSMSIRRLFLNRRHSDVE